MKYCILLLFSLAILSCRSPETRQYYQILRALNEYDIPRSIDAEYLIKQLNTDGRLDTIFPNGMIMHYHRDYNENIICYSRHKDSVIWNIYKYNSTDGKLAMWTRRFINEADNVDYVIHYEKNGKIGRFYSELDILSKDDYIMVYSTQPPKFNIHQIISILRNEDPDLFSDIENTDFFHSVGIIYVTDPSGATYPKKSWWQVRVNRYDENGRYGAYYRYFDNETGEVLKEWWEYGWRLVE